jgi:ATP-dependent helicase/nuclease subunit A
VSNAVLTQIRASDPARSVFVTANAGSGKTSTLVSRVARLLLRGAAPEAILCVTYTKAAAAEMQRRLFEVLGDWAVAENADLEEKLAALDEQPRDLARARRLFARALETPGGLKIQTIHAFCEKLLKRFPLEAGVSPGFQVLEDAAAAEVAAYARDAVAEAAIESPDGPIGKAYAHFAVELDWQRFNAMFGDFAARRVAISAYVAAGDAVGGYGADIWFRCGFDRPVAPETIEAEALAGVDWVAWRDAAAALANGSPNDQALAAAMAEAAADQPFGPVWAVFCTLKGEPKKSLGTRSIDAGVRAWLADEQARLGAACDRAKAARVARDTEYAITLALTYAELYEGQKAALGALDFGDLIGRTADLLKVRADAAWVLYKLDGGVDHILLDEAQDTAPEQWGILHALTDEFFAGAGRERPVERRIGRTIFAVGDEKQSIYSFQGARPEMFQREADDYRDQVIGAGGDFIEVPLEESWRSTPEVLRFVDAVFAEPEVAAGLTPGRDPGRLHHRPLRDPGFGAVEFWPLLESEPEEETDPWAPVDVEPKESGGKKLARRVARQIRAMIDARTAVYDKQAKALRPATAGDFLILVRRRNALFHEIIRALKREGVASGGADRLQLSEHIVFKDLVALGRFARFPDDDLTLAALLRSPFCDIDEQGLFDLAYGRSGSLWGTLNARAGERPQWAAARDLLAWVRAEAGSRPPFDVYSRALSRLDGSGRSMRARLLTRFGREAEDAVEAFLGEALGLEQRQVHDLERFLDQMVQTELEVKREAEDLGGEVRVMTVHGAKGLEAPIVILPDTTTRARAQGGPLLESEDGFLWAPRKADDCPASAEARAAREAAADQESLRLLYVALTRARDRLIIAGVKTTPQFYRDSWHEIAVRALERPEIAAETRVIEDGEEESLTRFGADPLAAIPLTGQAEPIGALPAWARRFAPPEPLMARYASPSNFVDAEKGPAPSPLAQRDGLGRFRRGILIHRLLQLLPDLAAEARPKAAASLLAREPDLTDGQRQEMAAAALGVLDDARFAAVFGPGSRAEAAIAGGAKALPAGLAVSGRIDRLLVEPGRVLVVDFKTNRPAPDRIENADRAYLTQMAIYVAVLAEVFPGQAVEAAIVWTDGPKLMPIPEKIVRETLAAMAAGG